MASILRGNRSLVPSVSLEIPNTNKSLSLKIALGSFAVALLAYYFSREVGLQNKIKIGVDRPSYMRWDRNFIEGNLKKGVRLTGPGCFFTAFFTGSVALGLLISKLYLSKTQSFIYLLD